MFGGHGSAFSAFFGVVVIQSMSSGLSPLNLSSTIRFEVTCAVLALDERARLGGRHVRSSRGRT